jgi:hypothetical protein
MNIAPYIFFAGMLNDRVFSKMFFENTVRGEFVGHDFYISRDILQHNFFQGGRFDVNDRLRSDIAVAFYQREDRGFSSRTTAPLSLAFSPNVGFIGLPEVFG